MGRSCQWYGMRCIAATAVGKGRPWGFTRARTHLAQLVLQHMPIVKWFACVAYSHGRVLSPVLLVLAHLCTAVVRCWLRNARG